ncbi:MAG: hypothetical protein HOW97_32075 [Catenulispora sp.]|nr:hypothetical protein [Catenulispora sp.]
MSDSITSADWPGGNKSLGAIEAKTFNLPQDATACYTFTDAQTGATWWYAEIIGHLRGSRYPFSITMSVRRAPIPGRHPFGLGSDLDADTGGGALVINERSLNTTAAPDQVSTFTVDPSMTSGTIDVIATDIMDKTWTVKATGTWRCA